MGQSVTPARVLTAGLIWRLFGGQRSAETLLDAVSGDDEQNRMLAGMSLVKAGERSFDLIEQKIQDGEGTDAVLRLLPDIDEQRARGVLNDVVDTETPLAETAQECIDTLDRIETFEESQG